MVSVDISNIWGSVSLPDLLNLEAEISAAHAALDDGTGAGSEYRGWMDLPEQELSAEFVRIWESAERIRAESDVLVVLGTGSSCLGARAVMELLQGSHRNFGRGKGDPMIFFAGNSFSTRQHQALLRLLEGKDFSLCVIQENSSPLESAIALRSLRWILERKYGTDEARRRVYAVTAPETPLARMAREADWETFFLPEGVREPYGLLSCAGLLPMAAAGLDISALLRGARQVREELNLRSFENPVWLYAAVRNLMHRSGKSAEILAAFEPDFDLLGRWWQQLFSASEGKDGKGLLPVPACFPGDLDTLGQQIREGRPQLLETILRFDSPEQSVTIMGDVTDLADLNVLEDRTLAQVEEQAFFAALTAHTDGGVPVICIDCGELSEAGLGALVYFFQLSSAVSAYALGVNPFDFSGAEPYRRELDRLLGRTGNINPAT